MTSFQSKKLRQYRARKRQKEDKITGRRHFQERPMSWSYRKRGRVPRHQIKQNLKHRPSSVKERKEPEPPREAQTIDKKRIERYSDKKITTNPEPEYSTLNPETNSDSPSAKSKGERLDSASRIKNKISRECILNRKAHQRCKESRDQELRRQKLSSRRDKQTS